MKRCTKYKEEKKKKRRRRRSKSPSEWMKKCSTKLKKSVPVERSWAELPLDLLGEIKKKLYHRDHVRFGGVCKTWLAAHHGKRAGDVLPMVMLLFGEDGSEVSYDLYEPLNLDQPVISKVIDLNQFFNPFRFHYYRSTHYLDGCLFLSVSDRDYTCTQFLIVSIPTQKAVTTLPQFNHSKGFHFQSSLKAVSTCPADPDCDFLALLVANHHVWSIGIFRHGDAQWTTTEFDFPAFGGEPYLHYAVFIRGVFYFLCYDQRLASYDIASEELKVYSFSAPVDYKGIYKFFGLDGELMLMYYDYEVNKHFLTSYDWSQNLWVPLKTLGDRSLFLSSHSVYLDAINYYGGSPNKIYVLRHGICCVYSFEIGELVETPSSGLRYWSGLNYPLGFSMWIEPPDLLPEIRNNLTEDEEGRNGRRPIKEFAQ